MVKVVGDILFATLWVAAVCFWLVSCSQFGHTCCAGHTLTLSNLRRLETAAEFYRDKHGRWPRTDGQSSWYEKLVQTGYFDDDTFELSGDRPFRAPTDWYGSQIVMDWPAHDDGRAIAKSLGSNGVDDRGLGDDWTVHPKTGAGYKQGWPAACLAAAFCAILMIVIPLLMHGRRITQRLEASGFVFVSGATIAAEIANPCGARYHLIPQWIDQWSLVSFWVAPPICLAAATPVLWRTMRESYQMTRYTDRCRRGECPVCGYRLDGNRSGVCPECGLRVNGSTTP